MAFMVQLKKKNKNKKNKYNSKLLIKKMNRKKMISDLDNNKIRVNFVNFCYFFNKDFAFNAPEKSNSNL